MKKDFTLPAGGIDFIRLNQLLSTKLIGSDVWHFERLASTNSLLKKLPSDLIEPGLVCVAAQQFAGRGQRQNKWLAHAANCLTFSVVLKPDKAQSLLMLLQITGFAVVAALKKHCAVNATLKWPNDVLVGGRKICGILAEGTFIGPELDRFVIGIGLNTNGDPAEALGEAAVSLGGVLGRDLDHTELLAWLLNEFEQQYFRSRDDLKNQLLEINKLHRGYGMKNKVTLDGKVLKGAFKFLGIDLSGYPVFLDEQDNVQRFTKEDVRFEPLA